MKDYADVAWPEAKKPKATRESTLHDELVERARGWLSTESHVVVITDMTTKGRETPDAIGWKGNGVCTLVECKASRADFLRDAKKSFRRPGAYDALGEYRWYLTPAGLLKPAELPAGWGLLETHGRGIRKIQYPARFESVRRAEVWLLMSALRRMVTTEGVTGIACRTYIHESPGVPRATVTGIIEGRRVRRKCLDTLDT